jgi:hypothetical protein
MTMTESVEELASDFWRRAGGPPAYPRNPEPGVLYGLPLAIVKIPRLRAGGVDAWFAARGRPHGAHIKDRQLRGCLFAAGGRGVIFVDAADPADEQRFSLTHEAAHFITDYLRPREVVLRRMGEGIADVLDGKRRPTRAERIDGLLVGVSLGVHRHLMDRGEEHARRIARSESRADRLALELLAPRADVVRRVRSAGGSWASATEILVGRFGLPRAVAAGYAESLGPARPRPMALRDWLQSDVELRPGVRNRERDESTLEDG